MMGFIWLYYTSRKDSWFWLDKGPRLIVMLCSIRSDMLLSLTAGGIQLKNTQPQRVLIDYHTETACAI